LDYKLSILVCTLPQRAESYKRLQDELQKQIDQHPNFWVERISNAHPTMSIGDKRNELLEMATGEYVCFIDDDDMISTTYIETILKGIETSPDCISLRGVITWDGGRPEVFEHSIRYKEYKTKKDYRENEPTFIKYERYPNHLNCIKASIAKQFKFPSSNFGEDTDWATQVFNSGLLKNEYYTDNILYQYLYRTNK
jgi:glycosyltransferase involved in cell wall biosynthesis